MGPGVSALEVDVRRAVEFLDVTEVAAAWMDAFLAAVAGWIGGGDDGGGTGMVRTYVKPVFFPPPFFDELSLSDSLTLCALLAGKTSGLGGG